MSNILKITLIHEKELPSHIESMSKATRDWTARAARGECGWVCSDCCMSDPLGMPDECFHKNQRCTEIIQRDKREAMAAGNEPQ